MRSLTRMRLTDPYNQGLQSRVDGRSDGVAVACPSIGNGSKLMFLGRVVGTVWATEKDPSLEGMKLLVVREVDLEFKAKQRFVVAVDTVQAGLGEVVLIATGSSARQTEATRNKPVDAVTIHQN